MVGGGREGAACSAPAAQCWWCTAQAASGARAHACAAQPAAQPRSCGVSRAVGTPQSRRSGRMLRTCAAARSWRPSAHQALICRRAEGGGHVQRAQRSAGQRRTSVQAGKRRRAGAGALRPRLGRARMTPLQRISFPSPYHTAGRWQASEEKQVCAFLQARLLVQRGAHVAVAHKVAQVGHRLHLRGGGAVARQAGRRRVYDRDQSRRVR